MTPKKWQLISAQDVSPSPWFPIEQRTYQLPNGHTINDFLVTTLADAAMIVAVTTDEKIVLVRQYKAGFADIILEFPAGRMEKNHQNVEELAFHELEEETGIRANSLEYFGQFSGFVTKATEKVYCFLAPNAQFNSQQKLDDNEEIEVVTLTFAEMENQIAQNGLPAAVTVAAWDLAKRKFAGRFASWNARNI